MIRLIGRRLIIPRGDTGDLTVPLLATAPNAESVAIFSILDLIKGQVVFQKEAEIVDDLVKVSFGNEETKALPIGQYVWDMKLYINPVYNEGGELISGETVDSYYAGFSYPVCEITLSRDRR